MISVTKFYKLIGKSKRVTVGPTWMARSRSGSSQPSLHSQWESRKVRNSPLAISAPRTRDRTRPSRFSLRISTIFWMRANSSPSLAAKTCERTKRDVTLRSDGVFGRDHQFWPHTDFNANAYRFPQARDLPLLILADYAFSLFPSFFSQKSKDGCIVCFHFHFS